MNQYFCNVHVIIILSPSFFRLAEWIQRTKRHDLLQKDLLYLYSNVKVCSKHFEQCMLRDLHTVRRQLKLDAVPTLHLNILPEPSNVPVQLQENSKVGASAHVSSCRSPQGNILEQRNCFKRQCNESQFIIGSSSSKDKATPNKQIKIIQTSIDKEKKSPNKLKTSKKKLAFHAIPPDESSPSKRIKIPQTQNTEHRHRSSSPRK